VTIHRSPNRCTGINHPILIQRHLVTTLTSFFDRAFILSVVVKTFGGGLQSIVKLEKSGVLWAIFFKYE
jgi:hypothetical protein